jgi:hypothetical protein
MKNLPDKYKTKIETIKNIILTTSGILSEYGINSIKFELADFYESENGVEEIVFELTIKDVYCPECAFEVNVVSRTINEIIAKIHKGCRFGLTKELKFKNSFNSTRGILLYETKLWRDDFEYIVFGIFLDPGQEY